MFAYALIRRFTVRLLKFYVGLIVVLTSYVDHLYLIEQIVAFYKWRRGGDCRFAARHAALLLRLSNRVLIPDPLLVIQNRATRALF